MPPLETDLAFLERLSSLPGTSRPPADCLKGPENTATDQPCPLVLGQDSVSSHQTLALDHKGTGQKASPEPAVTDNKLQHQLLSLFLPKETTDTDLIINLLKA